MKYFSVWLCATVIRLLGASIRMTLDDRGGILNHPDHLPAIIAFWHNQTALMAYLNQYYTKGRTTYTFISRSRDGQFITDVAARFGVRAVRGSSSRHGAAAALTAVHMARDPRVDIVITPDGPRGPRYQIQPGLIRLAQTTKRPIVTIRYELPWKLTLKSWDRFHIPLPFSPCRLITSEPIFVPEDATEADLEMIKSRVTEALGGD